MTMIEQVARALQDKLIRPGHFLTEQDFDDIARATIETVRDFDWAAIVDKVALKQNSWGETGDYIQWRKAMVRDVRHLIDTALKSE